MKEEVIIDEENFENYFKQINKHKPEKGDIIASYRAKAYLVNGDLKKDIIQNLKNKNKEVAIKLLMKLAYCIYEDAIRLSDQIKEDIENNLSEEEILKKEHSYTLEMFYYTKEEYVPKNNVHWTVMKIIN